MAAAALGTASAGRALATRARALTAVDPSLRHPLLLLPFSLSPPLLRIVGAVQPRPSALAAGVGVQGREVPGVPGDPAVPIQVYEPAGRVGPTGAVLWIHGGGYVMGRAVQDHAACSRLAAALGVVVISVDYRLAPSEPFPAALNDCHAALRWLHREARALGVDPDRIAVAGASAGGGLAAALAQVAHDAGEVPVAFQALVYPMLDDRTCVRTDHAGTGTFVWTPASNRVGWSAYLGSAPGAATIPPGASAARRPDLTGLPPAWIGVGELDLFHGEDVTYADRLTDAGVACELLVVPGTFHGADVFFPSAPPSVALWESATAALRSAVG